MDTPVVVYVYDNVHAVAEFCIIIKCCPTLKPCYATIDGKYKKKNGYMEKDMTIYANIGWSNK